MEGGGSREREREGRGREGENRENNTTQIPQNCLPISLPAQVKRVTRE